MPNSSNFAKTKFILKMIGNITEIIKRHQNITNALADDIEAQPALLMCLMQIGENLKKIDDSMVQKFDLEEELKGAYNVRNFIAHDYEGINLSIIENILRDKLPILKTKILKLKSMFESSNNE